MWFYAKDQAEKGYVSIPDDDYLKEELLEVRYFFNTKGKIQLEKKEDIKERLGRSPDRADTWVMCVWALKSANPARKGAWDDDYSTNEVGGTKKSAMTA